MIKSIYTFDIKHKRVLIRADLNVPINEGKVQDDFRLKALLPTLNYCLKNNAKIVLMSHLGRPKGKIDKKLSLMPIGEVLADLLEMPIKFSHDCISEDAHDVTLGLKSGEIHLLENLRFSNKEVENNKDFSAKLAKHGDIFINDAFGTAHREHASNVGIIDHFSHRGMGFLIEKEIQYFNKLISKPKKPLIVILGGSKVDSKLSLIDRFLNVADRIIIGGGMVFTFLKAQGKNIGNSIYREDLVSAAFDILEKTKNSQKLVFPSDYLCNTSIESKKNPIIYSKNEIKDGFMGLDIGPRSIKRYKSILNDAETIFWNGPMGVFENKNYQEGTKTLASSIAELTEKGVESIIGGGDSASALRKYNLTKNVTHLSTGGGASLELLSGKTLPALQRLEI